jgi:CHASE2 domain-containing sensor protein
LTSIKTPLRARQGTRRSASSIIDDGSLNKIGQWPWSRTVSAQLVDRLREAGAAVVAFDIDFAEPDRTSPKLLLPLRRQDWVTAVRLLDDGRLAAARFLAPVYDLYRRRIAQFQIEAPPADWDGLFTAKEK